MKELEVLARDVEYYLIELRRLERRTGSFALISTALKGLYAQLTFFERRLGMSTDKEAIEKASELIYMSYIRTQQMIFDETLPDTFFLAEVEGGKEVDIYLPSKCLEEIKAVPYVQKEQMEVATKQELIRIIMELSLVNERLMSRRK